MCVSEMGSPEAAYMGVGSGVKSHRSTPKAIVDQGVGYNSGEIGRFVLAWCGPMLLCMRIFGVSLGNVAAFNLVSREILLLVDTFRKEVSLSHDSSDIS